MRLADAADAVLEATVVPSFSRVGIAVRSRLDRWERVPAGRLDGRVVVVTGATSGLGFAATRALAAAGATVEIVARDPAKIAATLDELRAAIPGADVDAAVADLSELEAVRSAAQVLRDRHDPIDVLVHNAGALDPTYGCASNGIERTMASQVVGPFLLTSLLHDRLAAARPGRVVWVSSGGMYAAPLAADPLWVTPDTYDGTRVYARAKRAQVTLTEMLAARCDPAEVVVHAMHPGWALTPGVERSLPTFRRVMGPLLRTPEQGVDTLLWLATEGGEPLTTTGRFWLDRRPRGIHRTRRTRASDTSAARAALWAALVAATGADIPPA